MIVESFETGINDILSVCTYVVLNQILLNTMIEINCQHLQGVPKKVWFKLNFEFLNLGRVFLGVKNNSRNFENKKNNKLLSKILSK